MITTIRRRSHFARPSLIVSRQSVRLMAAVACYWDAYINSMIGPPIISLRSNIGNLPNPPMWSTRLALSRCSDWGTAPTSECRTHCRHSSFELVVYAPSCASRIQAHCAVPKCTWIVVQFYGEPATVGRSPVAAAHISEHPKGPRP